MHLKSENAQRELSDRNLRMFGGEGGSPTRGEYNNKQKPVSVLHLDEYRLFDRDHHS